MLSFNPPIKDEKKYNELFEFSKGVGLDCFASIFNKSDYNILKKTSNNSWYYHKSYCFFNVDNK